MGKFKATRAEMRARFDLVMIGQCNDMSALLTFEEPYAYSTRAEGWACDYYILPYVNGSKYLAISTGYAPVGREPKDAKAIKAYEAKARAFLEKTRYTKPQAYRKAILARWLEELSAII